MSNIDKKKIREVLTEFFNTSPWQRHEKEKERKQNLKDAGFYFMPIGERAEFYNDVKAEVKTSTKQRF